MAKIIIYCEMNLTTGALADVSYELISKVRTLTQDKDFQIEAVALGARIEEGSIRKAFRAGASSFVFIKHDYLSIFKTTTFANSFVEYYIQNPAEVIIFPATPLGRMVAPRITTALNTGLVADCIGLEFVEKNQELRLAPTRPTFGAELMATILSKKNPQCATIRPYVFKAEFIYPDDGDYREFYPDCQFDDRIKILRSFTDTEDETIDFSNARVVFAAGFGLCEGKERKYFERLEKLAELTGAQIASTRKVVDLELMPKNTQIGQTGSYTEADLYIAFGISGAIQHISGMKNCKTIIAVNIDENADIFNYADYKITADAKVVIDELLEQFT